MAQSKSIKFHQKTNKIKIISPDDDESVSNGKVSYLVKLTVGSPAFGLPGLSLYEILFLS